MAKKKIQLATDQRPFIMIYQDFLESDLLDNYFQKLVYIYLKKFTDSKNQCYPSVKTISKQSGISVNKVKITLKELEEKGIIVKVNRNRPDGGKSSNLYTLYDYAEIWSVGSSENVAAVAEEVSEMKLVAELRSRGYTVTKEKELVGEPTKAHTQAPDLKQFDIVNSTTNYGESQLERYTLVQIKQFFDYDVMIQDNPYKKQDIDSVMDILYTTMNTTKGTVRIAGEDKPVMVVISKLMKLHNESIMYAIGKYQEQTERIKNPTSYMLTILYNAPEQFNLDVQNRVSYDMTNRNTTE